MNPLNGFNIVPHTLALTRRWVVKTHPIRKRRRGWNVVRVEEPGCLQLGSTLFMHPDLIARMKGTPQ